MEALAQESGADISPRDRIAIALSQIPYLGGKPVPWNEQPEKNHEWFVQLADAAIAEMNPTTL